MDSNESSWRALLGGGDYSKEDGSYYGIIAVSLRISLWSMTYDDFVKLFAWGDC